MGTLKKISAVEASAPHPTDHPRMSATTVEADFTGSFGLRPRPACDTRYREQAFVVAHFYHDSIRASPG